MTWLRAVFGRPREHYHPSSEPFLELDLSEVRRQLRPAERGTDEGQRNLPDPNSEGLDSIEREITSFFTQEQNRAAQSCEGMIRGFSERLQNLGGDSALHSLLAKTDSACADLKVLVSKGRNELFDTQRSVRVLSQELSDFRRLHQLDREANYPESRHYFIAGLIFMLVAETVLNGVMLSRGNVLGLLGGGFEAFLLAFLNLALGFFAGRIFFSRTLHRRPAIRVLGGVGVAVYVVLALALNLAVAHYREALAAPNPANAAIVAVRTLIASPAHITDFRGWLLFIMGLGFCVVAAAEGLKIDDSYPGYGSIHKRAVQARADFIEERRRFVEDANAIRDAGLSAMSELADIHRLNLQQLNIVLERQQLMRSRFEFYQNHLEILANALLREYRSANEQARTTVAPAHFRMEWHLPRVAISPVGGGRPEPVEVGSVIDKCRTGIVEAHAAACSALASVEDLVGGAADHG